MTLQNEVLYLAGWASPSSSWLGETQNLNPYAGTPIAIAVMSARPTNLTKTRVTVATLDVSGYVDSAVRNSTSSSIPGLQGSRRKTAAAYASVSYSVDFVVVEREESASRSRRRRRLRYKHGSLKAVGGAEVTHPWGHNLNPYWSQFNRNCHPERSGEGVLQMHGRFRGVGCQV